MESRNTKTAAYQSNFDPIAIFECDELTSQRLDCLAEYDAETAREKLLFHFESKKTEAAIMKKPLSCIQTFSYFGLIIGIFLPTAIFVRMFLLGSGGFQDKNLWILGVFAIVNIISAVVGFISGKLIGKVVREVETYAWWKMLLLLPFIGTFWGIMAGGAGGIIILIIGAFFGALLGGAVGCVALPTFTIFHRLLKKGDMIELKHFLPLAFGITAVICAFILGL